MKQLDIQPLTVYSQSGNSLGIIEKLGLSLIGVGVLAFVISLTGASINNPLLFFFLTFGLVSLGALTYFIPTLKASPAGVKNNRRFLTVLLPVKLERGFLEL